MPFDLSLDLVDERVTLHRLAFEHVDATLAASGRATLTRKLPLELAIDWQLRNYVAAMGTAQVEGDLQSLSLVAQSQGELVAELLANVGISPEAITFDADADIDVDVDVGVDVNVDFDVDLRELHHGPWQTSSPF